MRRLHLRVRAGVDQPGEVPRRQLRVPARQLLQKGVTLRRPLAISTLVSFRQTLISCPAGAASPMARMMRHAQAAAAWWDMWPVAGGSASVLSDRN